MKSIKEFIYTYKDYPKKGIEFKDVLGIIQNQWYLKTHWKNVVSQIIKNAEAIISIDARGFIFGSAISLQAQSQWLLLENLKLPGKLMKKIRQVWWNTLSIQKEALERYKSFAIVDDLLATGGTANCVSKILEGINKEIVGIMVVVDLTRFEGRINLNYPVESFVTFD